MSKFYIYKRAKHPTSIGIILRILIVIVRCQMTHHDLVPEEKEERKERREAKGTRFGFSDQGEKISSLLSRFFNVV